MEEIWKDIKGYEGYYQISDLGNVKRLNKKVRTKSNSFRNEKEKILKKNYNKNEYLTVTLSKEHKIKSFLIHRLVANHFLSNNQNKPQVNHKNGIKTDNRVCNLEWSTAKENVKHAFVTFLKTHVGENNPKSKLSIDQVKKIKYEHKEMMQKDIAKMYNVSRDIISDIRRGKRWKHV